jgi:type VI secretion system protein VasG
MFGKLNSVAFGALDSAFAFCKLRGNPRVELIHWIHQILQLENSDLVKIVRHFEQEANLNPARLATDMTRALDRLPRGNTSYVAGSAHLDLAMKEAWLYSTLMFSQPVIRTGHLLLAIIKTPDLKPALEAMSSEFGKVDANVLSDQFDKITQTSAEQLLKAQDGSAIGAGAAAGPGEVSAAAAPVMGRQEALARFTEDLTEKARSGKMDPIVGRDGEIRLVINTLMRRRQNNPILTGEAGVGKTAVVEGFAQRIAAGDVPGELKDVSVRSLDVGLLQAGASMKGEFEQRLRQVIEEVQASPKPIILFIDEAHTLIGAGGPAGTGDAANLLKPAWARGTLRTIAATTWAEYKRYFEKDPALTRRFEVVKIEEPAEEKCIGMMRGIINVQEKYHRVQVLDEALQSAVRLSQRYISDRQLPDKAVKLIDTACARVAVSQNSVPPEIENSRRHIDALAAEIELLGRESSVGIDHKARLADVATELAAERARLSELEKRWTRERALVTQLLEVRAKLRSVSGQGKTGAESTPATATEKTKSGATSPGSEAACADLLATHQLIQKELADLQGESPLILPSVDAQAVAAVVADWTGVPVGRMVRNEIESVMKLAETLERRVIGQRHALDTIARRIQTSRAQLDNPTRPVGVFLLAGPSGVGKTETALTLAEALYGGEQNVITINMSEFQEAHTVSTLKGAPPGYVGYGEGGILTEAVRRRPYSVVLLDEVEKAHPDVHEIFFQVFDKGMMEDAEGRLIDFKNTIIFLTSNVGSDLIMNLCKDPDLMPSPEGIAKSLREPLLKVFPAALLGRLVVVPYYPISDVMLKSIIQLQLGRVAKRVQAVHNAPFTYDDAVIKLIASRCTEVQSGARAVDAIITHTILPAVSGEFLKRMMDGRAIKGVRVRAEGADLQYSYDD